jgi:hypothetical protein
MTSCFQDDSLFLDAKFGLITLEYLFHRSRVSVGREAHATAGQEAGVTPLQLA